MATYKASHFFQASQSVDDQLGKNTSFIWASYAGLRELWWQVRGYSKNFPDLHISEIEKKFLSGIPLPGGIDLKHICIDTEWSALEEEFSRWLLFDACTMYEGWAEKVCSLVFATNQIEKCIKKIQFPNTSATSTDGYSLAIQLANQNTSTIIKSEFFPGLSNGKFNKWSQVQQLLIGFRYFKECRNSFIHSDGKVTAEVEAAHLNFVSTLTSNPNLLRRAFTLPIRSIGGKIQLNVKDVILFTRIIKHLISTFDAALCVSYPCEYILESRLRKLVVSDDKWQFLPINPSKRAQRIHRILSASRIPNPVNITNVDRWMVSKGIIRP